jgi:hypothetical protein
MKSAAKNFASKTWTTTLALLLVSATITPSAVADGGEVALDYSRAEVQRRSDARPERALPRELTIQRGTNSRPAPELHRDWEHLARDARKAASASAQHKVDHDGRPQVYHAGYYDGLHQALDDPRLGRRDRRDGFERGQRARDAHRQGEDIGYSEANHAAEASAKDAVVREFHDLRHEPRYTPSAPTPAFDAPPNPAREPQLRDVFHSLSCHTDTPFGALRKAPWGLYGQNGYGDLYDRRWWDPERAFGAWVRRQTSYWRALSNDEKEAFQRIFLHRFEREVERFYRQAADRAYGRGFDYGYDHGAEVSYEWNYRQGFHEGWSEALRESARRAFAHGWSDVYEERYRVYFDDWSTNPHPEVAELTLTEAGDDGVFEPGETIFLDYEIINYGGAAGSFTAVLAGAPLAAEATASATLPRRQSIRARWPLEAVIDARTRPRTHVELDFRLGDRYGQAATEQPVPLYVSYPLELDRRVALRAHDTLAGRAVVEVGVTNTSRRRVEGRVHLAGTVLAAPLAQRLGVLSAGSERRISFELVGLRPLDLLGGTVELNIAAKSRGRVHDDLAHRLPALAFDLGERDLVEFMEMLARRGSGRSADVRRAQDLMLRRLRLDWDAVAAAGGNAYKADLKGGGRSTALGDLVATYRDHRGTFQHREVFTALRSRIEALAKDAPGAHPFLRRSMKKLARQLG